MMFSRNPTKPRAARQAILIEAVECRTLLSATGPATVQPDAVYLRPALTASATVPAADIQGFTPAQVRTAYGFSSTTFSNGTVAADGAGQTIAIVDAYNDPNIRTDLTTFDTQFGIAAPGSFRVVNQTGQGNLPATNADWAGEIALDVEWAHAIAPAANILLVETTTDDTDNLIAGVNYARSTPGVSVVSMSWGGSEYVSFGGGNESSSQTAYDADFTTPAGHQGVTFVSAAGDSGAQAGVQWPASSPNVVAVGGTSLYTADDSGTYSSEVGWSGTSGGPSTVESEPAYQRAVQSTSFRSVPDVSYDADPNTGFAVYDSLADAGYVGWQVVGGTSAGSPQWGALVADADQARAIDGLGTLNGTTQTLPDLYALYAAPGTGGYDAYANDFNDVTTGGTGGYHLHHNRGGNGSNNAAAGYDLVTGLGTPKAASVIAALADDAAATPGAPAGNGGATGSGGTPAPAALPLSPVAVTILTAPASSVVAGAAGSLKVRLTNSGQTPFAGPVTVTLYASSDGTLTSNPTTLATLPLANVRLKAGASRTVVLKFTYAKLPATPGSYELVASADATATDAQASTAATSAVAVAAATVDLSVAFAGADATAVTVTAGKKSIATLRVDNLGNVKATGSVVVTLYAAAATGSPLLLTTVTRKVKIVAGKTVAFGVAFRAPEGVAPGTYSLVASITPTTVPANANSGNDTATVPTRAA